MSESVNRRTDARTHGCQLEIHPIRSPRAFGSGELKICVKSHIMICMEDTV